MQKHQLAGEAARRAPSWYLARGDQRYGPLADRELLLLAERGGLQTDDLLWKPGFVSWKSVHAVCGNALQSMPTPKSLSPQDTEYFPNVAASRGQTRLVKLQMSVKPSSRYPSSVGVPTSLKQLSVQACLIELKDMRRNASSANASWYRTGNSRAAYLITLPARPRCVRSSPNSRHHSAW